jgi:hypothetical protein
MLVKKSDKNYRGTKPKKSDFKSRISARPIAVADIHILKGRLGQQNQSDINCGFVEALWAAPADNVAAGRE